MPNLVLPPPRQSISERKAIPGLDLIPSRLPQRKPEARKELNFEEATEDSNNKENDEHVTDDSSNFAKPLPPSMVFKEPTTTAEKKSLAKMILTRESMAGLPRASLSGLFRYYYTDFKKMCGESHLSITFKDFWAYDLCDND